MSRPYQQVFLHEKLFLSLMMLLMPIDYFLPTAQIFREGGAKPFNLFILLYIIISILFCRNFLDKKIKYLININRYLLIIIILGILAFLFNYFNFDYPLSNRSPEFQFFSQLSMFLLFLIVFNGLRNLFLKAELRLYIIKIIPITVFIHLLIFLIEFLGYFNVDNPSFLILFRNSSGLIDRSSGLMSEPSYFGVFAGLFVMPLLLVCKTHKILNGVMASALILFSILINAKTFFIVIIIQMAYLFFGTKKIFRAKFLVAFISFFLIISGIYVISVTSVFDFDKNLSSAMRIGSNLLALNVAASGYGLLGIGFGQFHFFYSPEYSPNFLMSSKEALDQMNNVHDIRASTFSLPLRILVEAGVLGFMTAVMLIYEIFKKFHASKDAATQVGMCFIFGSVGFLLTQDSYCLPSLALGLALVCTQPELKS